MSAAGPGDAADMSNLAQAQIGALLEPLQWLSCYAM